ncbi:KilA-N domain-containing protein [Acinetobacter indicus]|uniref:KilA-N domain-containing protein n=1 Tax=Acinetobacter indicus TaxID=756892 RepID=UPI00209B3894|nr:KilA-N domain-containing protein [Acinetobacter indicus]MCO8087248.1 KilA-N domain-containing protein [Acinetobacter indicus]
MSNLTQNLVNPNAQPLVIGDFSIRQDEDGRYCLNDLHKASGSEAKHAPRFFIRNQQTQDLIAEIEQGANLHLDQKAVNTIHGGNNRGTYVVEDLVYSYAMWISAKFHLIVIRAYKMLTTQWKVGSRQTISPEQKDTLHKIVDHKVNGNQGLRAQVWTRHNRHFKINSYHELLAIHFEDAVKYLLEMEVKQKVEKPEIKALPYPPEVIQVAQQINQEFNNSKYDSWHVSARNGVLTAMPLPPGFYPTMDIAEFTKRFDSVLDLLYGTDTLRVGRYMLAEMSRKP